MTVVKRVAPVAVAFAYVASGLGWNAAQAADSSAAAPATATAGPTLDEVLVTARRVEENVMTVPIAVVVVSDAQIQNAGVKDLTTLANYTPGLFAHTATPGGLPDRRGTFLMFRGLSTSSGNVFIDGAPYSGTTTPDVTDVARVEVLKGPQSVYFGRATFAGAVNFVTKAPGDHFAGSVSQDISAFQGNETRLMLEGPLAGDKLKARFSLRRFSTGGQYETGVSHTPLGAQQSTVATLGLTSSPSSNLDLSAYLSYTLNDDGPAAGTGIRNNFGQGGATFNCNLGGTFGPYYCGELPTFSQLKNAALGNFNVMTPFNYRELVLNVRGAPVPFSSDWIDHFGTKSEIKHLHLKGEYRTDGGWAAALLAGTSANKYSSIIGRDFTDSSATSNPFFLANSACVAGSTACIIPNNPQLTTHQFILTNELSLEARVTSPQDRKVRGTVGASYYKVTGPAGASWGIQNSGRLASAGGNGLRSSVSTPAIFGGLYWDATQKLKLSVEARYQWDGIAQQSFFPTATARLSNRFGSFSPRVTLDYTLPNGSLLYGTVSRGYRPGGFNAALLGITPFVAAQLSQLGTNITYDQEKLDNFEIGHKATWLDNRLRTTVALYQMNWANGQVSNSQFVTNDTGSSVTFAIISNVGRVRLRGLELETAFAATDHLTLAANLGVADNEILNYVYTPSGTRIRNTTDVTGNSLDQVPKVTFSFSPSYTRHAAGDWDWFARGDYLYRSKVYADPTNVAWIGARSLVNLHLGIAKGKDLKIEAYVNNLLDDDTLNEAGLTAENKYTNNVTTAPFYDPARPLVVPAATGNLSIIGVGLPNRRTVGLRATYGF